MLQAVPLLAGQVRAFGADEVALDERAERLLERTSIGRRQQLGDDAAMELAAFDRGAVDDGALHVGQRIDARREDGLDRRRSAGGGSGLLPHGHHLLEEERVALCGGEQTRALVGIVCHGRIELLEQVLGLPLGQRGEADGVGRRAS